MIYSIAPTPFLILDPEATKAPYAAFNVHDAIKEALAAGFPDYKSHCEDPNDLAILHHYTLTSSKLQTVQIGRPYPESETKDIVVMTERLNIDLIRVSYIQEVKGE